MRKTNGITIILIFLWIFFIHSDVAFAEADDESFFIEEVSPDYLVFEDFYGGMEIYNNKLIVYTTDISASKLQPYLKHSYITTQLCKYSLNELYETLNQVAVYAMRFPSDKKYALNPAFPAECVMFELDVNTNRVSLHFKNANLMQVSAYFEENNIDVNKLRLSNSLKVLLKDSVLVYTSQAKEASESILLEAETLLEIHKIENSMANISSGYASGWVDLDGIGYKNIQLSEHAFNYEPGLTQTKTKRTSIIRSFPGLHGEMIGKALKGAILDIVLIEGNWAQISWNNNSERAYTHRNNLMQ